MTTQTRPAVLAAGILAAALGLAGCSSDTDSAAAPESPTPADSAQAESSPAADHATGTEHVMDSSDIAGADYDADRPVDTGISEDYATPELAEGVDVPAGVDLDSIHFRPGDPPLTQSQLDALDPANELTVECSDPEALASNAGHEPAGWPAGLNESDPLPDPECHPDFIEVHEWDRFDDFHACWEGPETGTAVRTADMSDAEANRILWDQSRARANWEWPQHEEPFFGASDECLDLFDKHGG